MPFRAIQNSSTAEARPAASPGRFVLDVHSIDGRKSYPIILVNKGSIPSSSQTISRIPANFTRDFVATSPFEPRIKPHTARSIAILVESSLTYSGLQFKAPISYAVSCVRRVVRRAAPPRRPGGKFSPRRPLWAQAGCWRATVLWPSRGQSGRRRADCGMTCLGPRAVRQLSRWGHRQAVVC